MPNRLPHLLCFLAVVLLASVPAAQAEDVRARSWVQAVEGCGDVLGTRLWQGTLPPVAAFVSETVGPEGGLVWVRAVFEHRDTANIGAGPGTLDVHVEAGMSVVGSEGTPFRAGWSTEDYRSWAYDAKGQQNFLEPATWVFPDPLVVGYPADHVVVEFAYPYEALDARPDRALDVESITSTQQPFGGPTAPSPTCGSHLGAVPFRPFPAEPTVRAPAGPILPGVPVNLTADVLPSSSGFHVLSWDLGDGTTAPGDAVQHAYARPGTYTVNVTATDDFGLTASHEAEVTVLDPPPTARIDGPTTVPLGATVTFRDASTDAYGFVRERSWDLGDGATATAASVTHAFTEPGRHAVRLTVVDDAGQEATTTQTVRVTNAAPVAAWHGPEQALVGEDVVFRDASTDADSDLASWSWDLGDGATATGSSAQHAYTAAGAYLVTLTVADEHGATDAWRRLVVVSAPATPEPDLAPEPVTASVDDSDAPASTPPSAEFTVDRDDGVVRLEAPAGMDAYAWSLGDGTTAHGPRVEHRYGGPGAYVVELVVERDGLRAVAVQEVQVGTPAAAADARGIPGAGLLVALGLLGAAVAARRRA